MNVPLERVLAALADRTRLRALNLMTGGSLCVGDLVELLGLPQPTVSRHLGVLRSVGLVRVRTADRWRIYSLAPAGDAIERAVHSLLQAASSEDPELLRDNRQRARLAATGGCCPALSTAGTAPATTSPAGLEAAQ